MFETTASPVAASEDPCQITIEFANLASYHHHLARQQQYRYELHMQEQRHPRQPAPQLLLQNQDPAAFPPHLCQGPAPQPFQPLEMAQMPQALQMPQMPQLPQMPQMPQLPAGMENDYQQLGFQQQAQLQPGQLPPQPSPRADLLQQMQEQAGGALSFGHDGFPLDNGNGNGNGFIYDDNAGAIRGGFGLGQVQPYAHGATFHADEFVDNAGDMLSAGRSLLLDHPSHQNGQQIDRDGIETLAAVSSSLILAPSVALVGGSFPGNSSDFSSDCSTFYAAISPHSFVGAPSTVSSSPTITSSTPASPATQLHQLQQTRRPHHLLSYNKPLAAHPPIHIPPTNAPYNHHQHLYHQIQDRRYKHTLFPSTFPVTVSSYTVSDLHHPTADVDAGTQQLVPFRRPSDESQFQIPSHDRFANLGLALEHYTMSAPPLDQAAVDADIAAQQAAAQNYRPDNTGPGIDEIHPTEHIQKHYANADALFVEKTQKLPRAFPLYRPVRGDGNCGWRAVGFCYFELLVHSGSVDLIRSEKQRLLGLNDYLANIGGYSPYLFEDMVEETDTLFSKILNVYPDTTESMKVVSSAFNEDDSSNGIIYHLRLLAASYLKEHSAKYEGFLEHDAGVSGYCEEWIERPNCEIDHLRMLLLTNILLRSSDMVLEIAYLDRTQSAVLPTYRFPEYNSERRENTIIMRMSLLFRPDHYDIVYRPSLPSRAIAEEVLRRTHTPEQVAASLVLDWARAATIVTGEEPNAEADAQALDMQTVHQPTELDSGVAAPMYSFQADPLMAAQPVTYYEETPDLTPGSSVQHGEPLTPTLPPSSVPPSAPQTVAPMAGLGDNTTLVSDADLGTASSAPATRIGIVTDDADATIAMTSNPVPVPMATPSNTRPREPSQSTSSKRIKLDETEESSTPTQGQASSSQIAASFSAPPTTDDASHSQGTDYQVFHVANLSYGNPAEQQPSYDARSSADILQQLSFFFGSDPAPANNSSALFGTGDWSSSSLRSRFNDTFESSPMQANIPPAPPNNLASCLLPTDNQLDPMMPSVDPGQYHGAMPPPAPTVPGDASTANSVPQPKAGEGSLSTGNQMDKNIRFSEWHYRNQDPKLQHTIDRDSQSFRSKMNTDSHINSAKFQPVLYKPPEPSKTSKGSRQRNASQIKEMKEIKEEEGAAADVGDLALND